MDCSTGRHTKWLIAAAFAVLLSFSSAQSTDWPQWRGPNRDGISTENLALVWPPKELWRKYVGVGFSGVSISEGRLYTMGWAGNYDYVYCLNATNPNIGYWTNAYAATRYAPLSQFQGPPCPPLVDGNKVYTYSHQGYLYCFDKYTGTAQWGVTINTGMDTYGMSASPVAEGNLLILNAGGAGWAVNKSNGSNAWTSAGTASYASPFVVDYNSERTAIIFSDYGLRAVKATNGASVFSIPWNYGRNCADPIVYNGNILLSDNYGGGCALYPLGSGTVTNYLWKTNTMQSHISSGVRIGNYVYGADGTIPGGQALACIDLANGSRPWRTTVSGGVGSLLAFSSNKLAVISESSRLYMGTATPSGYLTNGLAITNLNLGGRCWGEMSFSDGRLYCRSSDSGMVVCLQVGTVPPEVSITSPSQGTCLSASNIVITADASDSDGTVTNVAFYFGTTLIGQDSTAPYGYTWNHITNGTYTLTSCAYDNFGVVSTSQPVTVSVFVDANSNGMNDAWETAYFGTNTCNPEADADGDNYRNFYEYVAGTDPTGKQSVAGMQITFSNGNLVVTCPTIQAGGAGYEALGRYYTIERISNLLETVWEPAPGYSNLLCGNGMLCYTNTDNGAALFYRARIRLR